MKLLFVVVLTSLCVYVCSLTPVIAEAAATTDVTRKSKKQIMLHYQTVDVPSQNSSQQQNLDVVTGSVDFKDVLNISNLTLFVSILLTLLTTETNSVVSQGI